MSKPVYLMFGPQGSGKSTQGEKLASWLKLPYFDAGAALRALVQTGSEAGERVEQLMQSGQLVPNATLRQLFIDFMTDNDCANGLVADGFPRNEVQIELLEELAKEHNWQIIGIFINISDETAKARLQERKILVNDQWVTRDDDQPEIVAKRLETFRRETAPIIEWLKSHNDLIEIDGEPPVETVTAAVQQQVSTDGSH